MGYVGKNKFFSYYYNKSNININREHKLIKVWIKMNYTEMGREDYIKSRLRRGDDITGYKKLDYTLDYYLYYYSEMNFKILSFTEYSISGGIITSGDIDIEWKYITPESVCNEILNKILKDYNIKG